MPKKQQEDLQGLDAAEGVEGAVLDGLDVVVVERPAGEQERPIITQGKILTIHRLPVRALCKHYNVLKRHVKSLKCEDNHLVVGCV